MSTTAGHDDHVARFEAAAQSGDVAAARKLIAAALHRLDDPPILSVRLADTLVRANATDPAHVAEVESLLAFADAPNAIRGNGHEHWAIHAKLLLGYLYLGLGRHEDANQAFRRAYNWRPDLEEPARMYRQTLEILDRRDEAAAVEREHRQLNDLRISALPRWAARAADPQVPLDPRALYLDLLEKVVCNWIYGDASHPSYGATGFDPARRESGRDLPVQAHSMIGLRRLQHLRWAAETVLAEGIVGDWLEAGAWRGGACILLRGVLEAHGVEGRRVYVADSFDGLPPPDPRFEKDLATLHAFHGRPELAVSLEAVRANFAMYGLLDDQVVFVPGFFKQTLPGLAVERLALLRLDGDLYASTYDTLAALYDKVSPGGFVICDDYGIVLDARRAVLDFRAARGIEATMTAIDGDGVFWRKV